MTRVMLVDERAGVRDGLRGVLEAEPDLDVVAEASTAHDALAGVRTHRPDVVVVDARLPDRSGVELSRDIRSADPDTAVILLTSFSDERATLEAVLAGASGSVVTQIRGTDLLDGIRRVASGGSLLDAEATKRARVRLRHPDGHGQLRPPHLTARQTHILDLIVEGLTNRQIGARLGVDEREVGQQVTAVLAALRVSRASGARRLAAGRRCPPG